MKNLLYIAIVAVFTLSGTPVFAQVDIQGSKSADWIAAGQFEYTNDKKPFHDIQYDAVPNHSIYYQVDISPTYFLTGTGNNYEPALTPQIPMENLSFWGIQKGQSASYDAAAEFVVTSPVIPTYVSGHLFNNSIREIGVTSNGVDRPLFTMNGLDTISVENNTIEPGTWKWYVITSDGRRKDGNQQVAAPFLNTATGEIYVALNSFNFWAFSGVFLRLDPVL